MRRWTEVRGNDKFPHGNVEKFAVFGVRLERCVLSPCTHLRLYVASGGNLIRSGSCIVGLAQSLGAFDQSQSSREGGGLDTVPGRG